MVKHGLLKKTFKLLTQVSFIGVFTFLLFELCFRLYVIDFYASNFESLNKDMEERGDQPTLMVIGDSFSASMTGYPKILHDSLSEYRLRNISVSGTSIREQYLFGRHHLKRENPDVLIFQFYVGNDFIGWDHQLNWQELSLARNAYWGLSEHFWSLSYVNNRLPGIRSGLKTEITVASLEKSFKKPFSPELYTKRDRLYFKSEPVLVENAAYLKGGREADFNKYMERVAALFDYASSDCQIYFLIVPHNAQLNERYKNQSALLGAKFTESFKAGATNFPLYDQIQHFFADDERITILNPIEQLIQAEESGNRVYFNNDSHLNSEGQRLLGEYLSKKIRVDVDHHK